MVELKKSDELKKPHSQVTQEAEEIIAAQLESVDKIGE